MSFFFQTLLSTRRTVLFALLIFFSVTSTTNAQQVAGITVPEQHNVPSVALGTQKGILVHVPNGYRDEGFDGAYPVMYVLNRAENFILASQVTDYLASKGNIPEMIVVGVPHSGNSRGEYKPYETKEPGKRRPAVDNLRQFFKGELIPFIDKTYRTKPSRILVGHSLAGLFTTDVFLNDPDLFNAYVALSPSYHHGPEIIGAAKRSMESGRAQQKSVFYSNIGGDEFYKIFDQYRRMQSVFKNHAPDSVRWTMKEIDNNSHRVMPLIGLYDGLTTIYAGYNLSMPQFRHQRYQGIIDHYNKLSEEMGYTYQPTKDDLESLQRYFANPDRQDDPVVAEDGVAYVADANKLLRYYYGGE
jgi:predicted alpha/beta superfamily hydrolase